MDFPFVIKPNLVVLKDFSVITAEYYFSAMLEVSWKSFHSNIISYLLLLHEDLNEAINTASLILCILNP